MISKSTPKVAETGSSSGGILPGIRASIQAFRAALPDLLCDPRLRGKYVAFQGITRVAIADDMDALIRLCIESAIPDDEYYIGIIVPSGLEEEEEIDRTFVDREDDIRHRQLAPFLHS
jgi:hypothetical protein